MYKCLTVVALVLLVLTGAMGLRNISANAAMLSASSGSAPAIWSIGPGVPPAIGPGVPPAIGPGVPPLQISGIGPGVPPAIGPGVPPEIGPGVPPAIGPGVPPRLSAVR
jgi:hypothetical protein